MQADEVCDGITKKFKSSICVACLGIFQNNYMNEIAEEIIENSDLNTYKCETLYTSITIPISLQIRELSLWIALIRKFPNASISECK